MYEIYCKLRDAKGMKDADVARETGITKSTFSDWKNGRSNPKDAKLQKIADLFGVSVEYIRTGEEKEGGEKYYLNEETAEMAQKLFENKDLRVLFDAAKAAGDQAKADAADALAKAKAAEAAAADPLHHFPGADGDDVSAGARRPVGHCAGLCADHAGAGQNGHPRRHAQQHAPGVGQSAAGGAGHYRLAGGENSAVTVCFQLCRPDAKRRRGGD